MYQPRKRFRLAVIVFGLAGCALVALLQFRGDSSKPVSHGNGNPELDPGGEASRGMIADRGASPRASLVASKETALEVAGLPPVHAARDVPEGFASDLLEALSQPTREGQVEAFLELARSDGSEGQEALVAEHLAMLGQPAETWNELEQLFLRASGAQLEVIGDLMRGMSDSAFYSFMAHALGTPDASVEHQVYAVYSIAGLVEQGALPELAAVSTITYNGLTNPRIEVRNQAFESLRRIGSSDTAQLIRSYAQDTGDTEADELADELSG